MCFSVLFNSKIVTSSFFTKNFLNCLKKCFAVRRYGSQKENIFFIKIKKTFLLNKKITSNKFSLLKRRLKWRGLGEKKKKKITFMTETNVLLFAKKKRKRKNYITQKKSYPTSHQINVFFARWIYIYFFTLAISVDKHSNKH